MGGIVQIRVARASDIESIPVPVDGVVYGNITFKPDKSWIIWDVTMESAQSRSAGRTSREGTSKNNQLDFTVPKDTPSIKNQFDLAEDDELIVLYKNANGKTYLYGRLETPMKFSYSHDGGQRFSDRNEYNCRFYYEGPDNRYRYEGAIALPPAGPAPAVVKFNGVAIASLAPGETLNILSDYSFSEYFTIAP